MKRYSFILAFAFLCIVPGLNTEAEDSSARIIMSADVSSGALKTFGELETSPNVGIAGTDLFAEDFGSIWELSGGRTLTFTFDLPQGAQNVGMRVREVGYPHDAAQHIIFIVNDERLPEVESAEPDTRKIHQIDLTDSQIRKGDRNTVKLGTREKGYLGIQTVIISYDLPVRDTMEGNNMSLRILSPIGGQNFCTDKKLTIAWESTGFPPEAMLDIQYRSGEDPWRPIARVTHNHPSGQGNRGYFQWQPKSITDNLQLKILYVGIREQ